jgi:hypothetical protein
MALPANGIAIAIAIAKTRCRYMIRRYYMTAIVIFPILASNFRWMNVIKRSVE